MRENIVFQKIAIAVFCVVCALGYLLLFSQTLSPLYCVETCDSSVFKLMGQVILNGKTPYVDVFDHKGPMLYCVQAFGQWLIPGRYGLFLIAVFALSVSIACWYKSARMFTTPIKSIVVIFLSLITYYFYFEKGNFSEDWNVPFISLSYFLILSLLFNKSKKYIINGSIIGLCLASSFFIRPNDAVAFIGAPIVGALAWLFKERKFQVIVQWVGGIIVGFSVVTLTLIVWFVSKNAISDLWYGLVGFNAKYATGITGLIKGCFKLDKLAYLPFLISLLLLSWQYKEWRIIYLLLPTVLAAYVLLGIDAYLHYWIVWIPILFFSYWLLAFIQENKAFTIMAICIFISLPIFNNINWLKTPIRMYHEIIRDMHYVDLTDRNTCVLFDSINLIDRDSIWSYNLIWQTRESSFRSNAFNVLLYNNIIPCNRVPLIFMAERDSTLSEFMDITKESPKYILFSPQHKVPLSYELRDSIFIDENYYVSRVSVNPEIILYKRRN